MNETLLRCKPFCGSRGVGLLDAGVLAESAFASVFKVARAEMWRGVPCGQPALNC